MPRSITLLLHALAARHRARRRLANLRAGANALGPDAMAGAARRPAPPARWIAVLGLAGGLLGGVLIVGHARHLGEATISTAHAAEAVHAANVYQPVLPGMLFDVPAAPGATLSLQPGGVLLVVAGLQAAAPVRVDLCGQVRAPGDVRMVALRLGYRFEDVRRWVERGRDADQPLALRNVLLVDPAPAGATAMPEVRLSGTLKGDYADPLGTPLSLEWRSRQGGARWISDASLGQIEEGAHAQVALRQQGWLLWDGAALRVERRAHPSCPQAGELLVQLYRVPASVARPDGAPARALVTAFPARGRAVSAWLIPGRYQVPSMAPAQLEDQILFQDLQARGLVRLTSTGEVAVAPRDLVQWMAAPPSGRAAELASWRELRLDDGATRMLKHLYSQADGAYVRQQIELYNGERHLLAWRVRSGGDGGPQWRASATGASGRPLTVGGQMPAASARLFAELPQGWQPWSRATLWPRMEGRLRLTLALPRPAAGGEVLQLLLAGRADAAQGAHLRSAPACTGRACGAPDDVQLLTLELQPGARSVEVAVRAMDLNAPEEQKYRHVRVVDGRLVWQALAMDGARLAGGGPVRAAAPVRVHMRDRNGTLLWADGAPTRPAIEAGLAPLLGLGPDHGNSVAGMLARLPAATGLPVSAILALDLPLQTLAQRVLDCTGMRRGHWDGTACAGGRAAPPERHAGLVILDAENGDLLAAAGAGAGEVGAANWAEVRDFDRVNPARSPLRLPALQHDGGAHQSPGSTFKVISALGLELAAQADGQLDSLLAGLPLAAINRLAARRGYGFQTDAASYPLNPRLAHITNYKEQSLDRRAQDGRLGLAQALTYSLNTWFAWTGEWSDRSLFGRPDGGAPDIQALDADALDAVRPIVAAAHLLGFEQALRLDGGLLPAAFNWQPWDALQATPAHIDPIHTRHELRQMTIGLRMQTTPLQMALAAAAVGQGKLAAPRLLLALDGATSVAPPARELGVRLDRIRAGMKGVIDVGTAAGAFGGPALAPLRPRLYGKTGTAPSGENSATVWFTGWLEPGSLPGQPHRLALAAFVSHSEASGGEHAAPIVATVLATLAGRNGEQRGK